MVGNCNKMLQIMFGNVNFNYNTTIEYIPIIRKNRLENYQKYFLKRMVL